MPFEPGQSGNPAGKRPGNNNRAQRAILRALARKGESVGRGLDLAADKLVEAACKGEPWAQKELYDRVDGKATQSVALTGAGGTPLVTRIELVNLDSGPDKTSSQT